MDAFISGTPEALKGKALSDYLMERAGMHWDSVPVPGIRAGELDARAIEAYRKKAVARRRKSTEEVAVSDDEIISSLKLRNESPGGYSDLMRAAVLMFHPDPGKFVAGASVKIPYFAPEGAYGANRADDVIYHDEVSGPLMLQADKVTDLVYMKYQKSLVSYEGIQRVETFMTLRDVFREVILNAISHKDYETGKPIQVSVYEDKIIVFNPGCWPEDIDVEELYDKRHASFPYNPNIARTFFNAGVIDAFGISFRKIRAECDSDKAPYPEVRITPDGVTVEIRACDLYMKLLRYGRFWYTYPEFTGRH